MTAPLRFTDKGEHLRRCPIKIRLIQDILEPWKIKNPLRFKALLMPCLHGEELFTLFRKGVPKCNICAIERDRVIWALIRRMRGIDVGLEPLEAHLAIDRIEAYHPNGFDLIYLDFYSQLLDYDRLMLQKIFAFRMLRPGSKLLLNYGKNRTTPEAKEMNEMLSRGSGLGPIPTEVDVRSAIEITGHRKPKYIKPHPYTSFIDGKARRYMTLEAQF